MCKLDKQAASFPEDRGRLVTAFLVSFFERITSTPALPPRLEEKLDDISAGRARMARR